MRAPSDVNIAEANVSPRENEDDGVLVSDYDQRPTTNLFATEKNISENADAKNRRQEEVTKENTADDAETILNENGSITARKQDRTVRSTFGANGSQRKTAYVMRCLKNMIEATSIAKGIESYAPEELRSRHDYDQFVDINCNDDTRLQYMWCTRSKCNDTLDVQDGMAHERSADYNEVRAERYTITYFLLIIYYPFYIQ